jgi:hypothetical protein
MPTRPRTRTTLVAVSLLLPLAACGRTSAGPVAAAAAEGGSEGSSLAPSGTVGAASPAAATSTAKAPPKLTSLPASPVAAGDLRDAYFHWDNATATFAGRPDTFFDEEDWSQVSGFTASGEKGDQVLIECTFAEPVPRGKASRNTPAVVRGTITGRSWATSGNVPILEMKDCRLVDGADATGTAGDPWRLDGRAVPIQTLYEAVFGWQGKTVQVVGRYDSSTHSSAGDMQRHDLDDAAGTAAVGCSHSGSAPAPRSAVDQRDGVIVEGIVGRPTFGTVHLEDCRFVNRS